MERIRAYTREEERTFRKDRVIAPREPDPMVPSFPTVVQTQRELDDEDLLNVIREYNGTPENIQKEPPVVFSPTIESQGSSVSLDKLKKIRALGDFHSQFPHLLSAEKTLQEVFAHLFGA